MRKVFGVKSIWKILLEKSNLSYFSEKYLEDTFPKSIWSQKYLEDTFEKSNWKQKAFVGERRETYLGKNSPNTFDDITKHSCYF